MFSMVSTTRFPHWVSNFSWSLMRPNKTVGHWPISRCLLVSKVSMIEGKTSGSHVQIVMVYRLTPSKTWCHDGVFVHIAICPGLELSSFAWGSSLTVPSSLGVLGCWWRVWQWRVTYSKMCSKLFGYMPKWIGHPQNSNKLGGKHKARFRLVPLTWLVKGVKVTKYVGPTWKGQVIQSSSRFVCLAQQITSGFSFALFVSVVSGELEQLGSPFFHTKKDMSFWPLPSKMMDDLEGGFCFHLQRSEDVKTTRSRLDVSVVSFVCFLKRWNPN